MRTTLVSTTNLKVYKTMIFCLVSMGILILLAFFVKGIVAWNSFFVINLVLFGFFGYNAIKQLNKIRTVSYDDSSVYYEKDGYEVQIPFEEIKNIELYRGWRINLYRPAQDGDYIMFIPSIWYPINFKKKEAEINKLRDKIDQYERTLPEKNFAGLSSYNI